jgi:hypothetical protein
MIIYDTNALIVRYNDKTAPSLEAGLDVPLDTQGTMAFRIQTVDHVDVGGQTWPVTMTCLAPGHYIGMLDAAVELDPLGEYVVVFSDTAKDGMAFREAPIVYDYLRR